MSNTKTYYSKNVERPIQGISIVLFYALILLGLINVFNGSYSIALLLAFLVTLLLYGISFLLKKQKASESAKNNHAIEYLSLTCFITIMLLAYPILLHFFNISVTSKDYYQEISIKKLERLKEAKELYQRNVTSEVLTFKSKVDNARNEYLIDRNAGKIAVINILLGKEDTYDIGSEVRFGEARDQKAVELQNSYALDSVQKRVDDFYNEAKPVFTQWNIGNVALYYNFIDDKLNDYLLNAKKKMPTFSFSPIPLPDLNFRNPFASFSNANFKGIILTLIIMGLFFIGINFPYYNLKRASILEKPEGGKTITV